MLAIRAVAVAALLATVAYLVWRALFTVNLEAWYLAVPMLALEAHAAVGLGLFSFSLWDVDRRPARRPLRRLPRIAVGEAHLVSFGHPGGTTSLWAQVRSSRRAPSGEHHYALEFEPGQYPARGSLARTVFAGRYPVAGTVRTPWAELLRRDIGSLSERFTRRPHGPIEASSSRAPIRPSIVNTPTAS